MRRTILACLLLCLAPADWAQSLTVRSSPRTAWIEAGPHLQLLNFDFIIDNALERDVVLDGVELSIYDSRGVLVRREFYDRDSRRNAELVPDRTIKSRSKLMVYNPFHTFAADVPLQDLRYRFTFIDDAKHVEVAEVAVHPEQFKPKTSLIPPLRGHLLVWDGHDYAAHHRRMDYTVPIFGIENQYFTNFQRYGVDLVVVDAAGQMSRRPMQNTEDFYHHDPAHNAEFYDFGADVLAVGAGTVVEMHDGEKDDMRFDPAELRTRETAYGGNYIIIDHGNGEFSWFGHLKQNSLRVKVGQHVKQGEVIASLGASGSSLFPHLHYELRSAAGAGKAEGLPCYFTGFRRADEKAAVRKPTPLNIGDVIDVD